MGDVQIINVFFIVNTILFFIFLKSVSQKCETVFFFSLRRTSVRGTDRHFTNTFLVIFSN